MADTGTALTLADSAAWRIACDREPVIRALAALPKVPRSVIEEVSGKLGLNRSRIFELVARYRQNPVTSSLLDRNGGFPKGQRRITPELDQLITVKIEQFYLTRPKPTLAQLLRRIQSACHEQGLRSPARNTVRARIAMIEQERLVAARDGQKAADDRYRPIKGAYSADYPLEVVQMDHTVADIIIVDELFRKPLCRPMLTLQVDIATRVIPGYYISLESPSATSVGMAIRHAVLPKAEWLKERDIEIDYPVSGIPGTLHLDNAREFHSRALERGCQQHGIGLTYRPKRTPHYGGHIERLIGTMIGEVHLLPGTTFSNIKAKGDYDAEGQACMTLSEFERWFALQVAIYHGTIHSALGVPPITAWADALATRPAPLRLPADQPRFLLDFLPFEMRKIRREGIELFHIFYWHGALATMIASCNRKLPVKYNPLNLSAVYLELVNGDHLTVPLRDRRRSAITKFEHDLAIKTLRERGRQSVDETALFAMVTEQRQIVLQSIAKTKSARRTAQRIAFALHNGAPPTENSPPSLPAPVAADEMQPLVPFQIEERS
jgi:putative transposase